VLRGSPLEQRCPPSSTAARGLSPALGNVIAETPAAPFVPAIPLPGTPARTVRSRSSRFGPGSST
jgi:hypothetical protein